MVVNMNMVVTVTEMNSLHSVAVPIQCNAPTKEVFGRENGKSGCRRKMPHTDAEGSVSVMETFVSR